MGPRRGFASCGGDGRLRYGRLRNRFLRRLCFARLWRGPFDAARAGAGLAGHGPAVEQSWVAATGARLRSSLLTASCDASSVARAGPWVLRVCRGRCSWTRRRSGSVRRRLFAGRSLSEQGVGQADSSVLGVVCIRVVLS